MHADDTAAMMHVVVVVVVVRWDCTSNRAFQVRAKFSYEHVWLAAHDELSVDCFLKMWRGSVRVSPGQFVTFEGGSLQEAHLGILVFSLGRELSLFVQRVLAMWTVADGYVLKLHLPFKRQSFVFCTWQLKLILFNFSFAWLTETWLVRVAWWSILFYICIYIFSLHLYIYIILGAPISNVVFWYCAKFYFISFNTVSTLNVDIFNWNIVC